jgi:hypothetical protein
MDTACRCVKCGAAGPESGTIDTQWSKYGWRVTRTVSAEGKQKIEFYCPDCWRARKSSMPAPT